MADLFTVTVPLVARARDGERRLAVAVFRHPRGLLCFGPANDPREALEAAWLVEGDLSGHGPWRVGDVVFSVLGCGGTDAGLAVHYAAWRAAVDARDVAGMYLAVSGQLGCGQAGG